MKRGKKIKISKDFNDFFIKNIIARYKAPNVDFEISSNNKINLVWLEGLKYKVDLIELNMLIKIVSVFMWVFLKTGMIMQSLLVKIFP